MSNFSNLNEECWFREYSVDFIFCCLILSCLNGYAIAQPMWRIGIAPNGMAQVAIGSFFTIINCSQSSCMVLIQEICQKWILESCSSSLMCRSKILGRQIKWAFIILLFINYYSKRTSIAPLPLSLLARSRHAGLFRDRSPCSNLKAACGIEATIFKLQFYPDGGHILEENKNKMSIYNIYIFFFFISNRNITNLKPTPPVCLSCLPWRWVSHVEEKWNPRGW